MGDSYQMDKTLSRHLRNVVIIFYSITIVGKFCITRDPKSG